MLLLGWTASGKGGGEGEKDREDLSTLRSLYPALSLSVRGTTLARLSRQANSAWA